MHSSKNSTHRKQMNSVGKDYQNFNYFLGESQFQLDRRALISRINFSKKILFFVFTKNIFLNFFDVNLDPYCP